MRTWIWATTAVTGLLAVSGAHADPPEAVKQVLAWKPMQPGVVIAMPTPAEQEKCTVSGDPKAKQGQAVWLLKDEKGQVLRRFVDTNSDKYPDVYSFYKDGMEVYREVDTKFTNKNDRFIWLNTGGSRIGISKAGNGLIDTWLAISLEEMSQEVMKAVGAKDWTRYAALLVNDEDLARIGVGGGEAERIRKNLAGMQAKFQQVAGKFSVNDSSKWIHVETGNPSRLLADVTGWKHDVLIHARVMILCETNGKTEYIQLADVVQVGDTWKLMDTPATIDTPLVASGGLGQGSNDPQSPQPVEDGPLQKLLKELADLDAKAPPDSGSGPNKAMVDYHINRAGVINRILTACPQNDRESWYKQLIDSLSATVSASDPKDKDTLQMFQKYAGQLAKQAPGTEVAGYGIYRLLIVENNRDMVDVKNEKDHERVQTAFLGKLTNFVQTYPNVSDTPEALNRLGEMHELLGKEEQAQKAYQQVIASFPNSKQAPKAAGAIRRLTSIGKTWEVGTNVTVLNGPGQQYNAALLQGKTVVVYYWGTFTGPAALNDFARMQKILQPYQAKGVVLVAVNLDDKQVDATTFLTTNAGSIPPSLHLHSPGQFESPAAVHYGLTIFPAMFLADSTGKITSRTLDVATLEEELKKIVK